PIAPQANHAAMSILPSTASGEITVADRGGEAGLASEQEESARGDVRYDDSTESSAEFQAVGPTTRRGLAMTPALWAAVATIAVRRKAVDQALSAATPAMWKRLRGKRRFPPR
ncbi:MAG: hypothetical protein KDA61_21565, partial [Planctomycetales bacterium]|nr:hypothetical protein [Planctomycetales bacterium]